VVTIHDLSFLSAPQHAEPSLTRYLRAAAPRALASATLIIAVSGTVAAEITEAYPYARDRIVAIPNGVRMPAARAKQAASGPPTVLAVGTIEPRKNLQATISAMRIVRQVFPEARLRIAGRIGWRADETVAAIRAAEASGIAEWHQGPGDEELERLYQDATIVAYPSFYEGFGLPVLEAMARGIPVVTSDICALRETAGDAARFVDPDDSEALAAEIISLLSSATLRQDYRERGLRRAGQFSWDETARRTRRVYQMAAAERQQ
jgi:glycosyltransferase involved in cell wall biosynthesis